MPKLPLSAFGAVVFCGFLAVVAVIGQWRLRLWQRSKKLRTGNANSRLLARWALLEKLCKANKTQPPEQLYWLAQKARFSQHTLSTEELVILQQALKKAHRTLQKRNFLLQPVYTLILAIY